MSSPPLPPPRVLIVDDDPVFRELLAYVLRADTGAVIVGSAADGVAGVELAEELHPDIVVMDLRMPGLDGFEATERIGANVPGARVVVVSSSTDPLDMRRAEQAGAAAYVPKDRAVQDLAGEIERLRPVPERPKRTLTELFVRRLVLG